MIEKDILGCAHENCDAHLEFGGGSPEILAMMFGGDKLAAATYMALQIGWGLVPEQEGFVSYCPAHVKEQAEAITSIPEFASYHIRHG